MTRATRFVTGVAGAIFVYVLLLLDILPTPLIPKEIRDQILPVLPWWTLVAVGSYLLWSLGMGIFTFRDCPEAYEELLVDIKTAKDYLRDRGVDVE